MALLMSLALLQAAAATAPAATTPAPEDSKVVCRTINPTGSRLDAKRICMTKAEWRRMSKEGEEATRDIQDSYSKPAEGN